MPTNDAITARLPAQASLPPRNPILDALRTLAIVLMVMSHLTRLVARRSWLLWNELSMLVEPLTQALFLFLVGASVVYSYRSAIAGGRGGWWRSRMLRRAAGLWLLGLGIYLAETGWQWPHTLTNPGVLSTIGIGLALSAVLASRPALACAISLGAVGLFVGLEWGGVHVAPLNAASSPWFPDLLELACGAAFAVLLLDGSSSWKRALALVAVLGFGLALLWRPYEDWFSEGWGRVYTSFRLPGAANGVDQMLAWVSGEELPLRGYRYFNPSAVAFPFLVLHIVALYVLMRPLWRVLDGRVGRAVLSIGRRALGAYVLHIVLLGVPTVLMGHRARMDTGEAALALAALLAACYTWALGREAWSRRRRRAADPAGL